MDMPSRTLLVFQFLLCSVLAQNLFDIRLAGINSNSSQGRLEIYWNDTWGTVCNDGFNKEEAIVACRQLGIGGNLLDAQPITDGRFGPAGADVSIHMDDLNCQGTEAKLANCLFSNWGEHDCNHDEDVGVICPTASALPSPNTTPDPTKQPVIPDTGNCTIPDADIRLIGPANLPGVGVVQVRRNNVWGGVCDNDWDILDARVVCGMLCFDPSKALSGGVAFDTSGISEPMTIDNVQCTGTEASIDDCSQSAWTENTCGRSEMAMVTCVDLDNSPPSRPQPLLDCSNGLLTASFERSRDRFLEEKHLSVALVYNGTCNVVKGTDNDYVTISIPFDECGTIRTSNNTHIIFRTIIEYAPTSNSGPISSANTYMVHVQCELPRDVEADKPLRPLTETVTQVAPGEFVVNMHFYRNNSFQTAVTQYPLEIPLGEWLNTALQLLEVDKNLRLVIPNCYATPSTNKNDPVRYPLFTDKCIDDETVGFFPLNDTWFGFRYQTFRFVQYPEVYIHCDAYICEKDDTTPQCDRSCFPTTTPTTKRRKKRSTGPRVVHVVSRKIVVYDSYPSNDIIRPGNKTTTERPNDEDLVEHFTSSPMTSSPKMTSQSQTESSHVTLKSEHVTEAPAEIDITEAIMEEIIMVESGASPVQIFMPSFIVILITFVTYSETL